MGVEWGGGLGAVDGTTAQARPLQVVPPAHRATDPDLPTKDSSGEHRDVGRNVR